MEENKSDEMDLIRRSRCSAVGPFYGRRVVGRGNTREVSIYRGNDDNDDDDDEKDDDDDDDNNKDDEYDEISKFIETSDFVSLSANNFRNYNNDEGNISDVNGDDYKNERDGSIHGICGGDCGDSYTLQRLFYLVDEGERISGRLRSR